MVFCINKAPLGLFGKRDALQRDVEANRDGSNVLIAWQQEAFRMHLKCGGIEQAEKLFDALPVREALQYTMLISALVKAERFHDAVSWFCRMQLEGTKADRVTFVAVVGAYGGIGDLDKAKFIHGFLYRWGYEGDIILGTALVNMYAKCQSLENARVMFRRISRRSVVPWNAMITAYTQSGCEEDYCREVIMLFQRMCLEGVKGNQVTFVSVLNAGVCLVEQEVGLVEELATASGFGKELIVQTALIKAYGRTGMADKGREIFHELVERDNVVWNTMVAAYEQAGRLSQAVATFWAMVDELAPNRIGFVAVLRACAALRDRNLTRTIHALVHDSGLGRDEELLASLLESYVACGSAAEARIIFDSMDLLPPRSWKSMIEAGGGVVMFRAMLLEGVRCEELVMVTALGSCSTLADAKLVHSCVVEEGVEWKPMVVAALVEAYGRATIEDGDDARTAEEVFENAMIKDTTVWNSLVAVHVRRGNRKKVFHLYRQMLHLGLQPNFLC